MNLAFGARTNWGKSYCAQAYTETNAEEFDRVVVLDYDDEYKGLVEYGLLKRLTVPSGSENISPEKWASLVDGERGVQLARTGTTEDGWREAMANAVEGIAHLDGTTFLVIDEAHRCAPQSGGYPDQFDTLATTWHGSGMGVVWITQRWAKFDEDVLSQCNASMLGGFGSGNDLDKVADVIEYPKEVHKADAERVSRALPDELLVDGESLTLRRFTDDEGNTIGSEWIYSDDTTLRRVNSQSWSMESTHYGKERKRIRNPFDDE